MNSLKVNTKTYIAAKKFIKENYSLAQIVAISPNEEDGVEGYHLILFGGYKWKTYLINHPRSFLPKNYLPLIGDNVQIESSIVCDLRIVRLIPKTNEPTDTMWNYENTVYDDVPATV